MRYTLGQARKRLAGYGNTYGITNLDDAINAAIEDIHKGLGSYRSFNKQYTVAFEGDDELTDINDGIKELCDENHQFRKRIGSLRKKQGDVL